MKDTVQAIILAAGKSSRFSSAKTKLAEPICGQPLIIFLTKLCCLLNINTTVVVGHEKELIEKLIRGHHGETLMYAQQEKQLGTGHALASSTMYWTHKHLLVINGDTPLITQELINRLYTEHTKTDAAISFVTSLVSPQEVSYYGRVVKTDTSISIVEAKDWNETYQASYFINAGIYLIKKEFLETTLNQVNDHNASNEFYITDLVKLASQAGKTVTTVDAPFNQTRGVNTLQELIEVEQIEQERIIQYWIKNGVRFASPAHTRVSVQTLIGPDAFIGSGVTLTGSTHIGSGTIIGEYSSLNNALIEDNVCIKPHTIINSSCVKKGSTVGPFAHIHTNSVIGENAIIGNFVEVKNSTIEHETKAKHLTYIGDATIGKQVNIGAGTITCNYNGIAKEKTYIKDGAFIGSNNTLVAPISIGAYSFTAAGSTITTDVPDNALAIARTPQINKLQYAQKLLTPKKKDSDQTTAQDEQPFSFTGARVISHHSLSDEQQ